MAMINLIFRRLGSCRFPCNSLLYCVALLLLLASCSNLRYLEEDQQLYTGAELKIESPEKIPERRELKRELEEVIRPNPNRTIFGFLRSRLWIHNVLADVPENSLRDRFKRRFGEEAVLFRSEQAERNVQLLKNRLFNNGFFNPQVTYEIKEKKRRVTVQYYISTGKPYQISEVVYPDGDREIDKAIRELREGSLLREGDIYRLKDLRSERQRLERALRNQGYFYFNENLLEFSVDTTAGKRKAALKLTIKPEATEQNLKSFTINQVFVHVENPFSEERSNSPDTFDIKTFAGNNLYYIFKGYSFRPDVLENAITIEHGMLYSRRLHDRTISRLMSIGTFRFASIRYRPSLMGDSMLNVNIFITPHAKRSIETEVKTVTKSTNYAGPALSVSLRNRNWLEGGEQLDINARSGFETRLSGSWSGLNSWELGSDISLSFPRLAIPFFKPRTRGDYLPRTRIGFGIQTLNRLELYRMYALTGQFGYSWTPNIKVQHVFHPVSLNFVRLTQPSDVFSELLDENPFLRQSFEEQFIPGMNYTFTYNTQREEGRSIDYYIQTGADVAGNVAGLAQAILEDRTSTIEEPYTLGGLAYSQYIRGDADFRVYQNLPGDRKIAFRFIAGAGLPYGNSMSLPFVKQFYGGGTNSIRAWHPRSLGPGSTEPPDGDERFADRTGDIKLESSLEYRFPIAGWFKGAFFADAGNVWLAREDEFREKAVFDRERFMNEIALGTGTGVRLDVSFFILRLDVAFPLHDPYAGWKTDEIDFTDRSWRRNNIIYNLAIGYPF